MRHTLFSAVLAAAALSYSPHHCQAQNTAPPTARPPVQPQQQQIVVTGVYTPLAIEELDRTVQVIPLASPLHGSPDTVFRSTMDALQSDAAVDLRQRAPGIQGDLSIRGSSFAQTLVLVNGFRVNDAQTGHNNLDLPLSLEGIDRIEVLQGAGSTIYGSDAVGGVVNFLTAPPESGELRFRAGGGSFGINQQAGSLALLAVGVTEFASFSRELSTGFMPNRDYRSFSGSSETSARSRPGLTNLLLGFSDRPFGAQDFYGAYPSWERTRGWFTGVRQQIGVQTDLSFSYRRHTDLYDLYRYQPSIYENRHFLNSWQAALRRWNALGRGGANRLSYGAEAYRDSLQSTNLGRRARDRGGAYASLELRALRRFSATLGAREDLVTGGVRRFSPAASGGFWLNEHAKLYGSAASSYRLPTFTDLYYSDPSNRGNSLLRPETAWSFEGGSQLHIRQQTASLAFFERHDNGDIDYVRSSPAVLWQAQNLTRIHFTGVEARWQWQAQHASRLQLSYQVLHGSREAIAGLQSKYVFQYPSQVGQVEWTGGLPGGIDTHLRLRSLQRFGQDPYALVDVSAGRNFQILRPYLQLFNLANAQYQEIPGIRLPGRGFIAGLEIKVGLPHGRL